jgi:hypothetical protein
MIRQAQKVLARRRYMTQLAVAYGAIKQSLGKVRRKIRHRPVISAGKPGHRINIDRLYAWPCIENGVNRFQPCVVDQQINILARRKLRQVLEPTQDGVPDSAGLDGSQKAVNL